MSSPSLFWTSAACRNVNHFPEIDLCTTLAVFYFFFSKQNEVPNKKILSHKNRSHHRFSSDLQWTRRQLLSLFLEWKNCFDLCRAHSTIRLRIHAQQLWVGVFGRLFFSLRIQLVNSVPSFTYFQMQSACEYAYPGDYPKEFYSLEHLIFA